MILALISVFEYADFDLKIWLSNVSVILALGVQVLYRDC